MKHTSAVSQLRALASAGLPPESFVPAFLQALHGLIPSDRNLFDWTDEGGRLVRYFFEGPIDHEVARHYFDEFHNRRECEVMPSFRDAITGTASILGASALDRPEFYRSALYNEIWRPQRLKTRIEAIIRRHDGAPLGSLVLYRGPGDKKFTAAEEHLLERIAPYVARGLTAGASARDDGTIAGAPSSLAFVCLGDDGQLTHLSEDAHRLLLLAHGEVTPDRASQRPSVASFPALVTVWRQWRMQGQTSDGSTVQVRNAWGQFLFAGCGLRAAEAHGGLRLHVTIQHFELETVALRRAVSTFDMTPVQQEVCLLMHAGHSQTAISELLKVSSSTIVDHVRKIYTKLDVHSANEFVATINRRASLSSCRPR